MDYTCVMRYITLSGDIWDLFQAINNRQQFTVLGI